MDKAPRLSQSYDNLGFLISHDPPPHNLPEQPSEAFCGREMDGLEDKKVHSTVLAMHVFLRGFCILSDKATFFSKVRH